MPAAPLGVLLWLWSVASAAPSDATLVYYNARMALREEAPTEAVQLWFLRNALEDRTGRVSPHDADFHSVAWAALAELGVCPDGLPTDEAGAGLWPLALHNHIVRTRGRRQRTPRPRAFDAFQVGRHQRHVAIGDVLSSRELQTVQLSRGWCVWPWRAQVVAGEGLKPQLRDRQVSARTMRHLLEASRATLDRNRVQGWAVVEARLFDLDLQLTALAAREARREAREQARWGRVLGLGRASVEDLQASAPQTTLDPASEAARILRQSVAWPVAEWRALTPDRRAFLFDQVRAYGGDPAALDTLALALADAALAERDGAEVEAWIARVEDPALRTHVWSGDRGLQLLGLDPDTGARERSVIALHRGVAALEAGDLEAALRSFALSLRDAPESRASEEVAHLGRRWLSYVAGRFQLTEPVVVTLESLLSRRDFAVILEDLLWRAAFHADAASFAMGRAHAGGRGALDRRLGLLTPLATGDVRGFSRGVRAGLDHSPSETLRFLDRLVSRLELESRAVRSAQLPVLQAVRDLVGPLQTDAVAGGRFARTADALVGRCLAIEEGVAETAPRTSSAERARALAPGAEVFVGSVRLAPSDALPWPYVAATPPAPSVFVPLQLVPEEWRGADGAWVLGWRIRG